MPIQKFVYNVPTKDGHLIDVEITGILEITDPVALLGATSAATFDAHLTASLGDAVRRRVRMGRCHGALALRSSSDFPGVAFRGPVKYNPTHATNGRVGAPDGPRESYVPYVGDESRSGPLTLVSAVLPDKGPRRASLLQEWLEPNWEAD